MKKYEVNEHNRFVIDDKIKDYVIKPILQGFHWHDLVQVIVGATLLAIPVAFTQEVWELGQELPIINIAIFMLLAITFITIFTYYYYHHSNHKKVNIKWTEFTKRVIITYCLSFIVVGVILTLINKAPWSIDYMLAIKRTIIVAFPASMSAAVADTLK